MHFKYNLVTSKRQNFLLRVFSPFNKISRKLNWPIEIIRTPIYNSDMITVEQQINLFHLLNEVIIHEIPGDVVELGCHTGSSALQIQKILIQNNSDKLFHVYDKFNNDDNSFNNIEKILISNFQKNNLELPIIHEGFFIDTIPNSLPEKISFAHIDCGEGADPQQHKITILHLLNCIYPRMEKHAVCLFMDYHDKEFTIRGANSNQGVKYACDEFFIDKKEKVFTLYGNHYSHGYFRKK